MNLTTQPSFEDFLAYFYALSNASQPAPDIVTMLKSRYIHVSRSGMPLQRHSDIIKPMFFIHISYTVWLE
jgi:hypothetical protein